MDSKIIIHLESCCNELEKCIASTEEVLSKSDEGVADCLIRVRQYKNIVGTQRTTLSSLREAASIDNWNEVARSMRIVSALSLMIRDDVRDMLIRAERGLRPALEYHV